MKIMHVAAPGSVGGLETVVQSLATGQRASGHRVLVALVVEPEQHLNGLLTPFQNGGVELHVLRVPSRSYGRERRLIRDLCLRFRPDVVHTHGCRSDVIDSPVARALRLPTISTVHGSSKLGGLTRLYELLEFALFRRFDAVVAVSRPLVQSLRRFGVPSERIHVIPNGWNGRVPQTDRATARAALGLPADRFVLGWVGRLIRVKGADIFLEALARLANADIAASIVGDGAERERLEALTRALGLQLGQRVMFHGQIDDAARLFPAFDAFVLSSRSEGTPLVLPEAIAAGVPVIATTVGGVPDLLGEDGGWLVPPEQPEALAQAIQEMCAQPHVAKQRVDGARKRLMTEFGPEQWLARYERVYRQCLSQ